MLTGYFRLPNETIDILNGSIDKPSLFTEKDIRRAVGVNKRFFIPTADQQKIQESMKVTNSSVAPFVSFMSSRAVGRENPLAMHSRQGIIMLRWWEALR